MGWPRLRSLAFAAAAALAGGDAFAGAQQYEVLSASVRATLSAAVNDRTPVDFKDLDTRAWVRAMTRRISGRFPDEDAARQFLALVRYEALRAGLDPHLVLAVIDVESKFRKYAVSRAGARGLMQVMPFWVKELGATGGPTHNLFHERINLRYGCTILRHYLDREKGNLANALGRYNGSLGQPDYPNKVFKALREKWALGASA
ncbi:MAG TPA: transglycosylase SLT domain-containing protein [Usitatibacter sp.]|jgi:soluble lytic murein transglycosylase-like protein|nr:transglycosylase SLT domain-containing protein [Usitatibacter sp.]